ncbi:MAG TPA: arsenite methyltransferase [Gemmatimonadaceae bacterium]|nr:arsenite methyltransferase [Gemmatimonadaceae bacterium]
MTTEAREHPTKVPTTLEEIRATVQARYGSAAQRVNEGGEASGVCCKPVGDNGHCCDSKSESWDPITSDLYEAGETAGLPAEALLASLGCGNPTALAELHEGETVLDLGSGGGIDVLLSARRVGPAGKAYGLDMTDEMLALALENRTKAGATNVEFLKGHIESIPLPSNTVDVIISNCVINLSGDKRQVLKEAFRVLKPGGRFAVSDVITRAGLPDAVRGSMALWTGCVAGALEESEFIALLEEAGFESPSIEPTRIYTRDDAVALLHGTGIDESLADQVEGKIISGFVRATKPGGPTAPAQKPRRELVPLGAAEEVARVSTRSCGCDDDCCT